MYRTVKIKDGLEKHTVCTSHCVGDAIRKKGDLHNVMAEIKDEEVRHLTLTSYESVNCRFIRDDLDVLCRFVNLQYLCLTWEIDGTDVLLEELGQLKGLKGFDLMRYERVNDENMNWLGELGELEMVWLRGCNIHSLEWLKGLGKLKALYLENNDVYSEVVYYCVGELSGLKRLGISGEVCLAMERFCGMEGLEELKVYSSVIMRMDGKKLGSLKVLDLSYCRISEIEGIEGLKNLKILNLQCCKRISSEKLCELDRLEGLEKLNVSCCQVNDEVMMHLSKLSKLEELDMQGCRGITDIGIAHTGSTRKLTPPMTHHKF